jgi:hypothetical protein
MPAAGGATPPQTPPTDGTAGAGTQPATGATDEDEPLNEGGKRALQEERKSAAKWKAEAETAKKALETLQQASLTESERRDQRLAELELKEADWARERQDWQTRDAVTQAALRLAYADPADAYSLIDRAAIEFDEGGKPTNVDKLLQTLIAAKPYLAGASRPGGSFDGGPRGAAPSGNNMNDILRRAAGH